MADIRNNACLVLLAIAHPQINFGHYGVSNSSHPLGAQSHCFAAGSQFQK